MFAAPLLFGPFLFNKFMVGIYKITSPTGKVYIGQSINIENRKLSYKGLHCKDQHAIYNSLVKYGFDNHKFEIVHQLSEEFNQQELNELELYYWQDCVNKGIPTLNGRVPGDGRGVVLDDTRRRISINNKGRNKGKIPPTAFTSDNNPMKDPKVVALRSGEFHFRFGKKDPNMSKRVTGESNPKAKLSLSQAQEIYDLSLQNKYSKTQLAQTYKVTINTISRILLGTGWKQVIR